ncbi:PREDICTED: uncharacterized protein LOC105361447 [Ceratosolen solmsi marchali]|uniref:Uncharacterized protein LOC105361447 n=1 Tax=Ceratosolen solmsi marchali TaxID=326594 RepID=A0AAJ6YF61_9HYME|nr:PREDICTED: uncharacterized protein LOC105361447 [Ceratosolen solmsi marchali]
MNKGLKNIQLGHLKDPIDDLHCINSLCFNIKQFLNYYNNGFDEYTFQFRAGDRKYEVIIKLLRESKKIVYGGYPWDSQYKYYHFKMKLNNVSGVGLLQMWQPYSNSCPIKLSLVKNFFGSQEFNESSIVYTLIFDDIRCQNKNIVGGKGASIAELSSIKTTEFFIPKGFCLTTYALELHIKCHTNLSEAINLLIRVCNGEKNGDLKEYTQKVVSLMENTPVIDIIKEEILTNLKQFKSRNPENIYAIRSSAIGEDNEDTSAAGQNSTYLGIKGDYEVLKYVSYCWASLYSYRSVEYRRQNGLEIKALMGVCIQQMVNADVAGVMFTRHPLTGNPKEIFINSNYGLGETVVSALVDPDTVIVQRNSRNLLSINTSMIGKKSQKISMKIDVSGTDIMNVSTEETFKLSISLDMALKLAEIAVTLDQLYNAPRDIEWALFQDNVYLLQCRPITSLNTWTDFELTHELGSGVPSDSDILTFSNVGEVLPMVLTPLTLSCIISGLNMSTESNIVRKPVLHTYTNHLFIANMRCTLNYMNLLLRFVEEKISQSIKVMEIAICGRSIITPDIHEMAKKRNGVLKLFKLIKQRTGILLDLWWNSDKVAYANRIVDRCRIAPIVKNLSEFNTAQDIFCAVTNMLNDFNGVSMSHSHTSKCSIFYQVLIMSILTEGNKDFTMEHYSDIAILLRSCSDVISAQVPIALKKITRTVRESGLSKEFKSVDISEMMNWLLLKCPTAYDQVQQFINIHGHRGIEEFELITETWSMKPEKFLYTIQLMMDSVEEDHIDKSLSSRETVAYLKTPQKSLTRWILRLLLPAMRKAVSQREKTKALIIEMVHNLRLAYRRLAVLLMKEGRLPDQALIFFLTHKELGELVSKPNPGLLRKATRRAKLRLQLQKYKYNEVNYGMLKPVEEMKISTIEDGICIQGTSVCNGMVTGRACIALTLEEAREIKPGDILITNATDIGWSPYFPLLGGVVTELGGLISHGAVVAREYGLPCIVSVENATGKFKTGEIVTLNGYTGTIKIHKKIKDIL